MIKLSLPFLSLALASCTLWKPTIRVMEKAATTTIDVAGKAAGAGIVVAKDQDRKAR